MSQSRTSQVDLRGVADLLSRHLCSGPARAHLLDVPDTDGSCADLAERCADLARHADLQTAEGGSAR